MISLMDVNTLVALFDPAHIHHERAHEWFEGSKVGGIATCPLTQNGLVRVLSNVKYPGRRTTVTDALDRLRIFTEGSVHTFWSDSISLLDNCDARHIKGAKQLTDVYLLALAVKNDGCLVTLDRGISVHAVPNAKPTNLLLLPA